MPRKRKREEGTGRVAIGPSHGYRLQQFVNALNGTLRAEETLGPEQETADQKRMREAPVQLREMVATWQRYISGGRRPSREMGKLWEEASEYWRKIPTRRLVPTAQGSAAIWWNNIPDMDPRGEALRWFVDFLLNPEYAKLAGPCARCGNYYIRRSARNKCYCSRSCGTKATATAATKKARQAEHESKLERARDAIRKYKTSATRTDWKVWVSLKAGITQRFLTRAVNHEELQEPIRRARREK
jgi:hypothetical protein